jgi:hypothetical protein
MARLGRVLTEALILHYGRDAFLRRLGDPFWFQSLGCVMGMDWHSSGITTSVMGALKRGLEPVQQELGVYICGGRGRFSRRTPDELLSVGQREGLDGDSLGRSSRLVAKVDSAALQDGFDLYLHSFVVSRDGAWTVIQQGMNTDKRQARRYHWISEGLDSFVDDPHSAIDGPPQGIILNMADHRATAARRDQVSLVHRGPDHVVEQVRHLRHLQMPAHHDVKLSDVMLRRLHTTLTVAADSAPDDFSELLLTRGLGARTVQALALVSEVIHGSPSRFDDPARFSFAHGGKDGHPFPVPLNVYDQTLSVLRQAVQRAKLGQTEKLEALRRLEQQTRWVDRRATGPSLETIINSEQQHRDELAGRTVFDSPPRPKKGQLELPGLTPTRR